MDRLIKWVDRGTVPPREQPLATSSPSGPLLKDAHGNAVGGVRSVDAPVASFFRGWGSE
jgi:hypothetical protein